MCADHRYRSGTHGDITVTMNAQYPQILKIELYKIAMDAGPDPIDPARRGPDEWPNTGCNPRGYRLGRAPMLDGNEECADIGEQRELVEIDTNYKDTALANTPSGSPAKPRWKWPNIS